MRMSAVSLMSLNGVVFCGNGVVYGVAKGTVMDMELH